MRNNQEQSNTHPEHSLETHKSATVQLDKLHNNPETTTELSPRDIESQSKKAHVEAMHTAISIETRGKDAEKVNHHSAQLHHGSINKKQRDESYIRTLKQVQSELPIGSRMFSKVAHNKVIEKTSDIMSNTIARPNAILSGAVVAFILTLLTYIVARTVGYTLSGFETIVAFIIGWIFGIIYDYLHILFTGKKL